MRLRFLVTLTQARGICGEGTLIEKNPSRRLAYRQDLLAFSRLMIDVGGSISLWEGPHWACGPGF